jgi:hypothetical protein
MDKLQSERNRAIDSIQNEAIESVELDKLLTQTFFFNKWVQYHRDVRSKLLLVKGVLTSGTKIKFRKCFAGWKIATAQLQRDKANARVKQLEMDLKNMQQQVNKKNDENVELR